MILLWEQNNALGVREWGVGSWWWFSLFLLLWDIFLGMKLGKIRMKEQSGNAQSWIPTEYASEEVWIQGRVFYLFVVFVWWWWWVQTFSYYSKCRLLLRILDFSHCCQSYLFSNKAKTYCVQLILNTNQKRSLRISIRRKKIKITLDLLKMFPVKMVLSLTFQGVCSQLFTVF